MKKKEIGILLLVILSLFLFRLYFTSFNETLKVGDIVEITGRVDAGRGKVETINGKYPRKKIYFLVDRVEDGKKRILGTIIKITNGKWTKNIKIEPEEIISKKNTIKNILISKVERLSKNYPIDFENFLRATLLGEKHLVDPDLKNIFRYTGTAHILVISGLHMGIIIAGVMYILLKLRCRKRLRNLITIIILTIYVMGIGVTPSVLRAYIMGITYLLGNIMFEKVSGKKTLVVSLIITLLIYPNWIYSISLWLSYIAVFSIIYLYIYVPKCKIFRLNAINKIMDLIVLSFIIQLSLTPIFYIYFQNIPLFTFIINAIVIPIASIFVIISFMAIILSIFHLGFILMPIAYYNYVFLIFIIEQLSKIPYLTIEL